MNVIIRSQKIIFLGKKCPGKNSRAQRIYLTLLTSVESSLPGLNLATLFAFICNASPVFGFLPVLAFLFDVENVPNPTKEILPPFSTF